MHTAATSKEQSESVTTRTGSTPAGVTLRPLCLPAPRSKDHAKPPRRSECLLDSVAHLCPFSRTPVFNGRRHIDGSSSFGPPLSALMALVRARHCRRREVQCRRGSGRTTDAWATRRTSRRHPPRRIPATWIPPARVRPAADNRRPVACRGRGSSRPRSTASSASSWRTTRRPLLRTAMIRELATRGDLTGGLLTPHERLGALVSAGPVGRVVRGSAPRGVRSARLRR
jgi:hypothetical protein